jgi:hypothetical protein
MPIWGAGFGDSDELWRGTKLCRSHCWSCSIHLDPTRFFGVRPLRARVTRVGAVSTFGAGSGPPIVRGGYRSGRQCSNVNGRARVPEGGRRSGSCRDGCQGGRGPAHSKVGVHLQERALLGP